MELLWAKWSISCLCWGPRSGCSTGSGVLQELSRTHIFTKTLDDEWHRLALFLIPKAAILCTNANDFGDIVYPWYLKTGPPLPDKSVKRNTNMQMPVVILPSNTHERLLLLMISSSSSVVSWLAPSKTFPLSFVAPQYTWHKLWHKIPATPMLWTCAFMHDLVFYKLLNNTDGKSVDGGFCVDMTWDSIPALLLLFKDKLHSSVM